MINNKGFMMAEVVVVSSIVLIFLTTIFTSYNKIYKTYVERISYYDVVTLYRLAYYRDNLIETGVTDTNIKNKMNKYIKDANNAVEITDNVKTGDKVILIKNNKANVSSSSIGSINIHPTFKDYLDDLKTSVALNAKNYVMVMERCENDVNNCKYAYLKIYDGKE